MLRNVQVDQPDIATDFPAHYIRNVLRILQVETKNPTLGIWWASRRGERWPELPGMGGKDMSKVMMYRWLYLAIAYGFRERPFPWAVGPHPRWLNRFCDWLHHKWLQANDPASK